MCRIPFGSNPGPRPELLPTPATRLPLRVTLPPLQDSQGATFRTPTRDPPLPLLSTHCWGVTIFKHLFNKYSRLQSDDTGEVLSKPVHRSANTRWNSQLRKSLPSTPSGGPPGCLLPSPARLSSRVASSQKRLLQAARDLASHVPRSRRGQI